MDRRTFMKRGLFGGGLLLLGGTGLALTPTRASVALPGALRVLSPRTFQIVAAIARRVVVAPDADAATIALAVDGALTRLPVEAQEDVNKLILLFENALGGLLLDGRALPFTRLSPEAQDHVLERWRDSRFVVRRTGYQALRKLCLASHYASPASWASLPFPEPTPVHEPYDDSTMGTPEWSRAHGVEGPL